MARPTLDELVAAASLASEPRLTADCKISLGGVDPLGLRQINFDLMDRVFPGVNNVAAHIRPFTVVTWAWRRAAQLAERDGLREIDTDLLRDFVDRVEVIYAWSQFLINPGADLPGRQVLEPLLSATSFKFGGEDWVKQRDSRRLSTAFSAPINYGPALKSLGWLKPDPEGAGAMKVCNAALPAVEALEGKLTAFLSEPAFSTLGPVTVRRSDVENWASAWTLDKPTRAEKTVMTALLAGEQANADRQAGVALAVWAAQQAGSADIDTVRRRMCRVSAAGNLAPTAQAWRRTQVRQAFRLVLEGLFAWSISELGTVPMSTERLVARFFGQLEDDPPATTEEWLQSIRPYAGPTEALQDVQTALDEWDWDECPTPLIRGLATCVREAADAPGGLDERSDRLPLAAAARDVQARLVETPGRFMRHVFEAWLFSQHTYWSVGRGLADARSGGKTLLRLRVMLEEGGWSVTKGAHVPIPRATPDRLGTILSLANEAGLLAQ